MIAWRRWHPSAIPLGSESSPTSCSPAFLSSSLWTQVLEISRIMVAWQPVGVSMGIYDMCLRYIKEREQFGKPLAANQLVQVSFRWSALAKALTVRPR